MNGIIDAMKRGKEVFFTCPEAASRDLLTGDDIDDAFERWQRFASYLKSAYPETQKTGGKIDSPLECANETKNALEQAHNICIGGNMFVKRDDCLAVCGSLKARGGIYAVLKHAEEIALKSGKLKINDDYKILNTREFSDLFSNYKISVGSTGNLGMSIGLSGKKLGFDVTVYMSKEAKAWKKQTLRDKGVNVIEFEGDYTCALKLAREEAKKEENNFFIDDEDSKDLFLGYSAAAKTLPDQLKKNNITIDSEHPLFVYLPCGVGGGPGGITFGLKKIFGENVYCFFGEPTEMPCMSLAFALSESNVSVYDIGLGGKTVADGLACSSPSVLAFNVMKGLLDGCFTVNDEHALRLTRLLFDVQKIKAEPSSCVALGGVGKFSGKIKNSENATHLVWLTGGSLVPESEWKQLGIY